MSLFQNTFQKYDWATVQEAIYNKKTDDVERALANPKPNLDDFMALIAPVAMPYLELMAQKSKEKTIQRFGKTIQLYAPLYLSNECQNICTYCGFSLDNKIKRKTLNPIEIMEEIAVLKSAGFKHLLLVTGEDNHSVHIDYFEKAIALIRPHIDQISIEVQPLETEEYIRIHHAGVHSVLVYQETYHKEVYKKYHPKGKKSNFDYRLDTPDRIGTAGIHKIGLGVLLGLEDWRVDSFFNALHLDYLQNTYWQSKYAVSFPRLRPAEGTNIPNFHMKDADLLQLICAYRIWNQEVEVSLSTRESEHFRNHIIPLGITSMSAGSKTNPGGYSAATDSLEQFEISDERSVATISELIKNSGYEPVWKDWDAAYNVNSLI